MIPIICISWFWVWIVLCLNGGLGGFGLASLAAGNHDFGGSLGGYCGDDC